MKAMGRTNTVLGQLNAYFAGCCGPDLTKWLMGSASTKSNAQNSRKKLLKTPKPATLKKYGLTEVMWHDIADSQNRVCFVCEKLPKSCRLCIDHEHVKGWKKMPPEQRRKYVRGLLCYFCNKFFLARGQSVEKAVRIGLYLTRYKYNEIKSTSQ